MLTVDGLVKIYKTDYGDVQAVKGVSFNVAAGEVVTLLGPSGCGKTTMLRCIAGLEKPDGGNITLDGEPVFTFEGGSNVPTHRRPISMVFQSYAIWPHMSVFDNIAYPLKVGKIKFSKSDIRERVTKALETVRIPELASRSATMLSGGQQQRVAVARALVKEPKLLLLDEPLSNLDAKLREDMRLELKELFYRTGISALYVTHDLLEALVLSDKIIVMNTGIIAQTGSPRDVYSQPQDQFVADFMGAGNVLPGTIISKVADNVKVDLGFGEITSKVFVNVKEGDKVLVAIRPEGIGISNSDSASGDSTALPCTVETDAFLGSSMEYLVRVGEHSLRVRTLPSVDAYEPGTDAFIHITPESCVVVTMEATAAPSS
jgi:iron(III) transport system ATP-binding protein